MDVLVLSIGKLILLALLYLFLARTVRIMALELSGTSQGVSVPSRPAVAFGETRRRPKGTPREVVVHVPDTRPRVVTLDDQPLTLGRATRVNVQVDDRYVSDEHVELRPDDEGWLVRDLGSTNGTFLNGAKITQATPIGPGDQIRLGKTRVEVRR